MVSNEASDILALDDGAYLARPSDGVKVISEHLGAIGEKGDTPRSTRHSVAWADVEVSMLLPQWQVKGMQSLSLRRRISRTKMPTWILEDRCS